MKFYLEARANKDGERAIVIRGRNFYGKPYRIFLTTAFPMARVKPGNWNQQDQKVLKNPPLAEALKNIETVLGRRVLEHKILNPSYGIPEAWRDIYQPKTSAEEKPAFPEKVILSIPIYKAFFKGKKAHDYLRILDQLEADLKIWNPDIVFSKLNFLALESLKSFLMGTDGKRKTLESSTIYSRFKYLRELATFAGRHGVVVDQSVYDFKMKYVHKAGGFALTWPELMKLFHYSSVNKTKNVARDFFLIEAFTGIRNSDCSDLRNASIHPEFIEYHDQKNQDKVKTVTRHKFNAEIIKRYYDPTAGSAFLLPALAQSTCNLYLKEIAKEAGLTRLISYGGELRPLHECIASHCGRHTYATLLNQLGISTDYIKEEIGHSQGLTFGTYVHRHDRYEVIRNAVNSLPMEITEETVFQKLRKVG
jgi:integrase